MIKFKLEDIYYTDDIKKEIEKFFKSSKYKHSRLKTKFKKEIEDILLSIDKEFSEESSITIRSEIIRDAKSKSFSDEGRLKTRLERLVKIRMSHLEIFNKFHYDKNNKLLLRIQNFDCQLESLYELKLKVLFYIQRFFQSKIDELVSDVNDILKNKDSN